MNQSITCQSRIPRGDAGAHCDVICDGTYPTLMLTYWARDRQKGNGLRISLPEAVNRLTRSTALAIGLVDRGLIAPGLKADLNIVDYDNLRLGPPEVAFEMRYGWRTGVVGLLLDC